MQSIWGNILVLMAVCLVILLPVTQAARVVQQEGKDQEKEKAFQQEILVKLQQIYVTASGRAGKWVTDLRPEEFTLRVNGRERKISTFDAYYPPPVSSSDEADAVEDSVKKPATIENPPPPRTIVLFFDQFDVGNFRSYRNARLAARELISRYMGSNDNAMVIGYTVALRVYQDFTSDIDKLKDAIDKIKYKSFPVGITTGVEGRKFDPDRITTNIDNRKFDPIKFLRMRDYLECFESISRTLKVIPGRKIIVFLSEGMDQQYVLFEMPSLWKKVLASLNDADCSVYSIDIMGMETPGGAYFIDYDAFRQREDSRRIKRDSLVTVATETGGQFYFNSSDFELLMGKLNSDISHYYALGFYLEEKEEGRFLKINVKTTRPGVKLQYRKRYRTSKPFEKLGKEDRLAHLEEGFFRTFPISELDIELGAVVFHYANGDSVAGLIVEAPIELVTAPEFEILGYVFDKDEKLVDACHKKFSLPSMLESATFHHRENLLLSKGGNVVKFVIRDNHSGKRASRFLSITVPETQEFPIASSIAFQAHKKSLVPGSDAKITSYKDRFELDLTEQADPLAVLTEKGVYISPSHLLSKGLDVALVIRIDGIEFAEKEPSLVTGYSLESSDGTEISLEEKQRQIFPLEAEKSAVIICQPDLSEIPSGDYVLKVRVGDTLTKKMVEKTANISLEAN